MKGNSVFLSECSEVIMNIERALEILGEQADVSKVSRQDLFEARQLGLEALKSVHKRRTSPVDFIYTRLPGETE